MDTLNLLFLTSVEYIYRGELASTVSTRFHNHSERRGYGDAEGTWAMCEKSCGGRLASDGISNHLEYKLIKILDLNKAKILLDRQGLRNVIACAPFPDKQTIFDLTCWINSSQTREEFNKEENIGFKKLKLRTAGKEKLLYGATNIEELIRNI